MIEPMPAQTINLPRTLLYALPALLALAAVGYPLSDWLVDDAGISFAYARNLAHGAGLVSQPGKAPVEGFSNPLWTLLMVPGYWLSANAHVVAAKLLGHLFAFGAFCFGIKIVVRVTGAPLIAALAMLFLAFNTSFAVWSLSGLENALYAFSVAALAYFGLVALDSLTSRNAVVAGLFAAAVALTRPEGILFAALWPWALVVRSAVERRLPAGAMRTLAAYVVAAAAPYLTYRAAAWLYFGSPLPNTYYAKGAPGIDRVWDILQLHDNIRHQALDLLSGPFGFAWPTIFVFAAALAICLVAQRPRAPLVYLVGATGLGFLLYLLLPGDWMGEYRFGTPFLVLFYPTLFALIWRAGLAVPRGRLLSRQFPALAMIAMLAVAAIFVHKVRFERFYAAPTVSIDWVAHNYAEPFNRVAALLGVEHGSFLLPDMGGTLLTSKLKIYDIAGLVDATIARTLWTDKKALRAYIFDQVKPTFIVTYAYSTLAADLDADPKFRRDYIALRESEDAIASERAGRPMLSGAYVRREVVKGRPEALARARALLEGQAQNWLQQRSSRL